MAERSNDVGDRVGESWQGAAWVFLKIILTVGAFLKVSQICDLAER